MSDFLSSFGKIFLFCTFLPGLVGCVLIVLIFPEIDLLSGEWYVVIGIVYGIGFVANAIGHGAEVLLETRNNDTEMGRFCENYLSLCQSTNTGCEKFIDFYHYAENIHIWYWNSASIIFVILTIRIIKYGVDICAYGQPVEFDWNMALCMVFSLAVAVSLIRLTDQLRKWVGAAVEKFCEQSPNKQSRRSGSDRRANA